MYVHVVIAFHVLIVVVYLYFLLHEVIVHENDSYAHICLELQQAEYPIQGDIWVNFTTESHSASGTAHFK